MRPLNSSRRRMRLSRPRLPPRLDAPRCPPTGRPLPVPQGAGPAASSSLGVVTAAMTRRFRLARSLALARRGLGPQCLDLPTRRASQAAQRRPPVAPLVGWAPGRWPRRPLSARSSAWGALRRALLPPDAWRLSLPPAAAAGARASARQRDPHGSPKLITAATRMRHVKIAAAALSRRSP